MLAIAAKAISLILLCQGIVNAENYDLLNATHQIWNAGFGGIQYPVVAQMRTR